MTNEAPMTNREKAVAIAKDVLKHVRDYRWFRGTYIHGSWRGEEAPWTGDLREHLDKVQEKCTMCLLGACLMSKARLFDAVPLDRLYKSDSERVDEVYNSINPDRGTIGLLLRDIFSPLELAKIESAFERRVMTDGVATTMATHDLLRGAALFGKKIVNDGDRVTAVMENIIANDGEFVVDPVTYTDYLSYCGSFVE